MNGEEAPVCPGKHIRASSERLRLRWRGVHQTKERGSLIPPRVEIDDNTTSYSASKSLTILQVVRKVFSAYGDGVVDGGEAAGAKGPPGHSVKNASSSGKDTFAYRPSLSTLLNKHCVDGASPFSTSSRGGLGVGLFLLNKDSSNDISNFYVDDVGECITFTRGVAITLSNVMENQLRELSCAQ